MLRMRGVPVGTGVAVLVASIALVQTTFAQTAPAAATVQSCPSGLLSVYYARGESTPSDETVALIGRIGAQAAACLPDAIDLVTDIDTEGEDSAAVQLALARLGDVASALIAKGVPADHIRLAARATGASASPMGEVSVIFRRLLPGPDDAVAPAAPARLQTQPDKI